MYLSNLKIWNFRKYGQNGDKPGLDLDFNNGLNLLVGENDSGKTAIIDAIKHVVLTQSKEYIGIEEEDFHKTVEGYQTQNLKIECMFSGFDADGLEAAHFLEWVGFSKDEETGREGYELKIWLNAEIRNNRVISDIKAGADDEGTSLDGNARGLLRATYLKPLRDAEAELSPGYKSRLAQILKSHPLFDKDELKENSYKQDKKGNEIHPLEVYIIEANNKINKYFKEEKIEIDENKKVKGAKEISDNLTNLLKGFFPDDGIGSGKMEPNFEISNSELSSILKKLSLTLENKKSGLGSLNLLFIATELLLLETERKNSLQLLLIEEIEAHLHAQAQLRLIEYFKSSERKQQLILTTHSITLASKIPLENLVICKGNKAFPMGHKHTQLNQGDYKFLERFLDATKANLFFARGVIIVEGDAENLLIPTIAEIIGRPLHKYGVSIVNVGSTAFKRYARIFLRFNKNHDLNDNKYEEDWLDIPVAIITDLDERPFEYYADTKTEKEGFKVNENNIKKLQKITSSVDFIKMNNNVYTSVSDFKQAIRNSKKSKDKNLENGVMEKIIAETKFDKLSPEIIENIRNRKYKEKIETNKCQNNRSFAAKFWTLEYELALSDLKEKFYEAVLRAERLQNDNKLELQIDEIEVIQKARDDFFVQQKDQSPEEIAYKIYKPLIRKNDKVSKAITAQCFAKILLESNIGIKSSFEKRKTPLRYLYNAIIYATTKEYSEDERN